MEEMGDICSIPDVEIFITNDLGVDITFEFYRPGEGNDPWLRDRGVMILKPGQLAHIARMPRDKPELYIQIIKPQQWYPVLLPHGSRRNVSQLQSFYPN